MLLGRERRKVGKGEEGDVLASPCVYWQRVGDHPDAQLETGVPKLCRCRYGQPLIMKKKGAEWCVPYVHLCMCVRLCLECRQGRDAARTQKRLAGAQCDLRTGRQMPLCTLVAFEFPTLCIYNL